MSVARSFALSTYELARYSPQKTRLQVASVTYPSPHFGPNLEDRYHLLELSASLLRNWPPNVKP